MMLLTILYDDYIDRPKLTEQKNPFEYIVPPPTKVGRNKIAILGFINSRQSKFLFHGLNAVNINSFTHSKMCMLHIRDSSENLINRTNCTRTT